MGSIADKLRDVLSSSIVQIGGAITAGAIAVVGAMLSPIGDHISHLIWPEKIQLGQTLVVGEGQSAPLNVVVTNVGGSAGVSGGTITLRPRNEALQLSGPDTFTYEKSSGSQVVKSDTTVVVQTFGEQALDVTAVTNSGQKFTGTITVKSIPKRPTTTIRNMTGDYNISLNDADGSMKILQADDGNGNFVGTADVSGAHFEAKGWHDGLGFHVTFVAANGLTYRADGVWCVLGDHNARFLAVNAKVTTSMLGAIQSNPHPLSEPDRCPDFPNNVSGYKGDGSFYASVPLQG